MEADFSGYATKANLKCSDGRTIMPDAFKHQDGMRVPLVWHHRRDDPSNVLGHAILEARDGHMYAHAFFNEGPSGQNAKHAVKHGDINALSIWANKLVERSKDVMHGMIREVSLVMAGANPGALIDHVNLVHSDGSVEELDDEAIITTDEFLTIEHAEDKTDSEDESDEEVIEHDDDTVKEIYESMNTKQKDVLKFLLSRTVEAALAHEDDEDDSDDKDDVEHSDEDDEDDVDSENNNDESEDEVNHEDNSEGSTTMGNYNAFEKNGSAEEAVLSHDDMKMILNNAQKGGSFKDAVEGYALQHGIENIDVLFPDAKAVSNSPELIKRRTEWVSDVMTNTKHTPFSRIKSLSADLTYEDARAKGYVTGSLKKEEFFAVAKRVTTPQTIYKKQKLDRDDILDITDFDVVAWLKGEMRIMLDEEVARAVLMGDGRSNMDEDKIFENNVRPIATDHPLYQTTIYINLFDDGVTADKVVDDILMQRRHYRGTGTPAFYTTETLLSRLLTAKDSIGRRLYSSEGDLASALRVSRIVPVEAMEGYDDLLGIIVNLQDYTIGADRGGDVSLFDDFDIDYNQHKYLIETRLSGALTKAKSALVVRTVERGLKLAEPEEPTFTGGNTVSVPEVEGVVYKNFDTGTAITDDVVLSSGQSINVVAVPEDGTYYFATTAGTSWTYNFRAV